jgi:hypothetical protein
LPASPVVLGKSQDLTAREVNDPDLAHAAFSFLRESFGLAGAKTVTFRTRCLGARRARRCRSHEPDEVAVSRPIEEFATATRLSARGSREYAGELHGQRRKMGPPACRCRGYAIDDQTAMKVTDGTVEIVSEGTGSCPRTESAATGDGRLRMLVHPWGCNADVGCGAETLRCAIVLSLGGVTCCARRGGNAEGTPRPATRVQGYLEGTGPWARAGAVGLADFLKLPRLAGRTWSRVDTATRRSHRPTSLLMKGSPVRVRASALVHLQGFLWLANELGPLRGTSGVHSTTPSRSMLGSAMLLTSARFAGVVGSSASCVASL